MSRNVCTKYWNVTCNNYTEDDITMFKSLPEQEWVESCICCTDYGENETPHIHAIIVTVKKQRRTFLNNRLNKKCHIEHCRDLYASWMYVSGRGEHAENKQVFIIHNPPKKVQRRERNTQHSESLNKALLLINDARTLDAMEFIRRNPVYAIQHPKAYRDLRSVTDVRQIKQYNGDLKRKNLWIVGKPGAGKTRLVYNSFDNYVTDVYNKPAGKWWEHWYDSQWKCILIDDVNHYNEQRQWSIDTLKKVLDRYPMNVEMKGSSVMIDLNINVVVTSQFTIDDVVINRSDAEALKRRCTIIELTKSETDPIGFSEADKATTIWEFIDKVTPSGLQPFYTNEEGVPPPMDGQETDEITTVTQGTDEEETTDTDETDSITGEPGEPSTPDYDPFEFNQLEDPFQELDPFNLDF